MYVLFYRDSWLKGFELAKKRCIFKGVRILKPPKCLNFLKELRTFKVTLFYVETLMQDLGN